MSSGTVETACHLIASGDLSGASRVIATQYPFGLPQHAGRGRFVFPGARSNGRPMSENVVLAGLRRLGILKEEMSRHGFRAMARTYLDEVLGFLPDYIEHRLAPRRA